MACGIRGLAALVALAVSLPGVRSAMAQAGPPRLACAVRVPPVVVSGARVPLTMTVRNRGAAALAMLTWGTPFEDGWFEPFVRVTRAGAPLAFGGAMVKRGDPEADEYLSIAPGQRRQASVDLALVFDLSVPGRYVVTPQVTIHDAVTLPASLPRARAAHAALPLACAPVTFEVRTR
ncbi:MAG: hypothetical protein K2R93_05725 [Gemmatimonadaceae bacterium]|nr:hypothetical protein [Gemmatimonadaceae bacterium]